MKVKDFPGTQDLASVKIRLPKKYDHARSTAGLNTADVYIISVWECGFWVKPDLKSRRMYPITGVENLREIREYEVIVETTMPEEIAADNKKP